MNGLIAFLAAPAILAILDAAAVLIGHAAWRPYDEAVRNAGRKEDQAP